MKSFIKESLRKALLTEAQVTQSQLDALENELDNLFTNAGIDIEFTRHFIDRVNDERNGREITIEELRTIFKDVYAIYKNRLKKYGDGFEAVFKNPPTSINIPFVLQWDNSNKELDLVNKTIMRKKNFMTSNDILYVSDKQKPVEPQVLYSAVVLDEIGHTTLAKQSKDIVPEGWQLFMHHMTIGFGKSLESLGLGGDEGKEVSLTVTHIGMSDMAIAARVQGYKTTMDIPHVTIAVNTAEGGKPAMSNEITDWEPVDNFQITGKVVNVVKQ